MKIARAISFLALGGLLIGLGAFTNVALREGFWPGLAVMLICFGMTLIGTATAAQVVTCTSQSGGAPIKKLRDVRLRYRVAASIIFGGISLYLFGVVFALARQAGRAAADQAWAWAVLGALIALITAAGAFCGLIAWGALSDPTSRLGAWVQRKPLDDAVHYFIGEAAGAVLLLFGAWL